MPPCHPSPPPLSVFSSADFVYVILFINVYYVIMFLNGDDGDLRGCFLIGWGSQGDREMLYSSQSSSHLCVLFLEPKRYRLRPTPLIPPIAATRLVSARKSGTYGFSQPIPKCIYVVAYSFILSLEIFISM